MSLVIQETHLLLLGTMQARMKKTMFFPQCIPYREMNKKQNVEIQSISDQIGVLKSAMGV